MGTIKTTLEYDNHHGDTMVDNSFRGDKDINMTYGHSMKNYPLMGLDTKIVQSYGGGTRGGSRKRRSYKGVSNVANGSGSRNQLRSSYHSKTKESTGSRGGSRSRPRSSMRKDIRVSSALGSGHGNKVTMSYGDYSNNRSQLLKHVSNLLDLDQIKEINYTEDQRYRQKSKPTSKSRKYSDQKSKPGLNSQSHNSRSRQKLARRGQNQNLSKKSTSNTPLKVRIDQQEKKRNSNPRNSRNQNSSYHNYPAHKNRTRTRTRENNKENGRYPTRPKIDSRESHLLSLNLQKYKRQNSSKNRRNERVYPKKEENYLKVRNNNVNRGTREEYKKMRYIEGGRDYSDHGQPGANDSFVEKENMIKFGKNGWKF